MSQHAKDNAIWAAIAALLMLGYGWGIGLVGTAESEFYNATVDTFNWMLRIGGICMAVVSIACFAGLRVGLLLDVFVSGSCGLIMALSGTYWMTQDGISLFNLGCILFGGMFLNAARGCWSAHRGSVAGAAGGSAGDRGFFGIKPLEPPKPPPKAEPPHPASIRPKSLPKDGGPPPGGYLSALAKEDEEPPTASFE